MAAEAQYRGGMLVSAADVAAALRERHPGLPRVKLLYYCQGHHLATFGRPLFHETVSAWDMGPVVGYLWRAEKDRGGPAVDRVELGEAELNTVGYVLSRYEGLTGRDLIHLTHSEDPWQLADVGRPPGTSAPIEQAWIERYFRSVGRDDEGDETVLDAATVHEWLRGAAPRRTDVPTDDADELARRVAALRAKPVRRG